MINLKIYKYKLVNLIKVNNMTQVEIKKAVKVEVKGIPLNEIKKEISAWDKLDNATLKKNLLVARNVSNKVMNCIGILAEDVARIIGQHRSNLSTNNITESKDKKFDTEKSLREFCFWTAGYNRKDKNLINPAFEMTVTRAIRGGKIIADNKFGMTVKNGELMGINNKINPTVPQKNYDKKIKKSFIDVENTNDSLISVNANMLDKAWKMLHPVAPRDATGKKSVNISSTLKEAKDILEQLHKKAKAKKDAEVYSKLSDDDCGLIADIKLLVSDDLIRQSWDRADREMGMDMKPIKVAV
jgi:hypothetical protein